MKKNNLLLLVLFVLSSLYSLCQNNRIYGIVSDSMNSRRIVYYDLNTNTTQTAYDLYLNVGNLSTTNFNGTSDPYNGRYFFGAFSDSTQGYQIFTYDISTNILSSIAPSIAFDNIEYNPFTNQIIAQSNGSISAIDLGTGSDSILVTDFSYGDYGYGTFRTFDPINQRYAKVSGAFGNPNYVVADIINDTIISNINLPLNEVPNWQVYDDVTQKCYGLTSSGSVVSFDMFTGNQTQIISLPSTLQLLNAQQATFDHQNGILYMPFYNLGQAQLAIIDVQTNALLSIVPFPEADLMKVFTSPRPSLRVVGNEIMTVHAESYQWYLNGAVIPGANTQKYTINQSGYFKVLTTFFNGKMEFSDSVYLSPLGLQEATTVHEIAVYPNPVNDFANIDLTQLTCAALDLKIFNSYGQIVYTQTSIEAGSIRIDSRNLQNGLFFFQVLSENKTIGIGKFIVE
jgi:hypothetical protein